MWSHVTWTFIDAELSKRTQALEATVSSCSSLQKLLSQHRCLPLPVSESQTGFVVSSLSSTSQIPASMWLHCLSASDRVNFKADLMVNHVSMILPCHNCPWRYIILRKRIWDVDLGRQLLSSIAVPVGYTVGDRSFPLTRSWERNKLPEIVCSAQSLSSFKRQLQTVFYVVIQNTVLFSIPQAWPSQFSPFGHILTLSELNYISNKNSNKSK